MAALDSLRVKCLWGLLVFSLGLAVAACGGGDTNDVTASTTTPTETVASANSGAINNSTQLPQATTSQATAAPTGSSSGGGTVGLNEALDRAIELYEELFDALASVTDEASARAAADNLAGIISQFEELDERMGDYSDAEIASAALSSRFFEFSQKLSNEMLRISANPAVFMLLGDAFDDLGNLSSSDSEEVTGDTSQANVGGVGVATLIVGGETWTFSDIYCGFSPEETGNDRVSFTLGAFGESSEGVRIQLDVSIQDTERQGRYQGSGVIHSMSLNDIEDFENPSVAWSVDFGFLNTQIAEMIQVVGKTVTATGDFDDGRTDSVIEAVPGIIIATCP